MRILSGDIGGTRSRFCIVRFSDEEQVVEFSDVLPSAGYESFDAAVDTFLTRARKHARGVECAAFAVAGPVDGNRARVTNLPWTIDGDDIETRLGAGRVTLLNDFTAIALGLESIASECLRRLQTVPPDPVGPRAVIGAGTGLGQALMTWNGRCYAVHATEGGHVDFSPRDEVEVALRDALRGEFGHVSVERVVSGPGLVRLFDFLCEYRGHQPGADLAAALRAGDGAAVVSRFALEERDPVCAEALERFVALYGAQAGNLALTCMPRGGLYVAGGIAPKILPAITGGRFLESFLDKGRMRPPLERIPVSVVIDPDIGLRGAAVAAHRRAAG